MKLLLDTHIFLWSVSERTRLTRAVREALDDPGNGLFLSTASIWEIAIKRAAGRLDFPLERLDRTMEESGIAHLPILPPHAIAAGALPLHHRDPFDRMLVAQAMTEGLVLVSDDRAVAAYGTALLGRAAET